MSVFEADASCASCKGTGLYVGMAERDGAAVVCHTCKGTGCQHLKVVYEPFLAQQPSPPTVERVYRVNPGIVIGKGKPGEYRLADFGGVPVNDWHRDPSCVNRPGAENRQFTCPAWWYQSADSKLKPDWNDEERKCSAFGSFSGCKHFHEKAGCWAKFDREQAREAK